MEATTPLAVSKTKDRQLLLRALSELFKARDTLFAKTDDALETIADAIPSIVTAIEDVSDVLRLNPEVVYDRFADGAAEDYTFGMFLEDAAAAPELLALIDD